MNSIFGRYIPGKGFLYNLDPRLKLLITIAYIILVFFVPNFFGLIVLLIPLMIAHMHVTNRPRSTFRMMKIPLFIAIVLFIVNIYTLDLQSVIKLDYLPKQFVVLFAKSDKYIYDVPLNPDALDNFVKEQDKILQIYNALDIKNAFQQVQENGKDIYEWTNYYGLSLAALNRTVSLFVRIYIMILAMSVLTNSTRPILLTKSIEDILWPFKLLKLPVHIVAMIISIALRFIPTLLDEANRIMKAQTSRGVSFKHGSFKDKIVALTTLIIPLFVSSFAKAEDLSNSMETRGYDPYQKRTKYRLLKPGWTDFFTGLVVVIVIIGLSIFSYYINHFPADFPEVIKWFNII
ncbi:energy-coupling factor transporter transmembrane component T family protein [Mycoplasma hafezii]|uniref:energy-coupling factor transporter transmembrane component T family protein n=1 Tax=Mycoplasma hafezii TaxID=525886 RepID=UPI003CEE46AE